MKCGHIEGVEKRVSRLVQGTMMVSSRELDYSFGLLDAIYAQGCNTFDTAHVYGGGDNERTVGRWVNERGLRDKVVIIGKGAHHNQDRKRVTPFDISADLHDSLARFKFDYIDIYLLHRDDTDVPVGPIVEALNEHYHAGRIHAFGGSNWSYQRIEEANEYARRHALVPFIASSPNYSLAEQVKEPWPGCVTISGPTNREARKWYASREMALFTWSSLAGGFFSGRFDRDTVVSDDNYFDKLVVDCYCYPQNFERLDRVKVLAEERGVSIPQIALAYVMNQPQNIYALTGARSSDEFLVNSAALDIHLSDTDLAWLDLERDHR
ncbi:MAG: aldo/keto reductase [Chloroflexi bacterium]|nr:aldo/keto reductase [Chloroflexota bacterium]MCL5273611.1 aldo/keto reductase [Chloroflexota bacterium]